jgi:chemotaxis protein methyltransferase CheR
MNSAQPVVLYSADEIAKISSFVSDQLGLVYSPDRTVDLIRGFQNACREIGVVTPVLSLHLIDDPRGAQTLKAQLIKNLTIGETYFFRDRRLFVLLRDQILPDLIRERRNGVKKLRIWSAGCSTGEEPYSIAMIIRYLLPDINNWDIVILGTDINPDSLRAAEQGVYSKWSFREEKTVPIEKYFSTTPEGKFQISQEIRDMVRFTSLNLVTDRYPSNLTGTTAMDLILCRNVLMYFSSDSAAQVVDRLSSSIVDGGWFVVSPQEISYAQRSGLIQTKKSSVYIFQKSKCTEDSRLTGTTTINSLGPADNNEKEPDRLAGQVSKKRKGPAAVKRRTEHQHFHRELVFSPSPLTPAQDSCSVPENACIPALHGRNSGTDSAIRPGEKPGQPDVEEMGKRARTCADQGDSEQALGWCDKILAADPLSASAYHLRAVIQQENGQDDSSVQSLKQALYADPDYISAHLMLGNALKNCGKFPDAVRHYQIVLSLLSDLPDDALVDGAEGIVAARLREIVSLLLKGVNEP